MSSIDAPSIQAPPRWHGGLVLLLLIAATFAAMGRLCTNDFTHWDDQLTIHQNPWLAQPITRSVGHYWTTAEYGLYMPLTYTVWAIVAAVLRLAKTQTGISLDPHVFHSVNVFFHLLAVCVVYQILRLIKTGRFAAACGAMLFGVHPIQVEAVGWVSGLKDVLSGLLALVALWQYILFARSSQRGHAAYLRFALATAAFVLAMLAKASAMALPLAALAIDRYIVGRRWRHVLPGLVAWLMLTIPLAIVARLAQNQLYTPATPIWFRPLIATDALTFYLGKLVWPFNLAVDYGRNPSTVLADGQCFWNWIVPAAIAVALIAGARRRPTLLAAGAVFLAGCLPVLGFSPAAFQVFSTPADHYLYLSMLGPAIALTWLISDYHSAWLRVAVVAVLLALIGLSVRQDAYWHDDFSLFMHNVEVNPSSSVSYINLGQAFERAHDTHQAIESFADAARAQPEYPPAWENLAAAFYQDGHAEEAIAAIRRAIDLQVKYPDFRLNWPRDNDMLGRLLFDSGRFAEAIPYIKTASDLEPNNTELAREFQSARQQAAAHALPPSNNSLSSPISPGR